MQSEAQPVHFKNNSIATMGVEGLDTILNGGLPRNHSYLLQGQSGTGKTTLGMQFLLEGARRGEKVLYITLSETASDLRQMAESHGWSLEKVYIHELTAAQAVAQLPEEQTIFHSADVELGQTTDEILESLREVQPDRAVFDSVTEVRLLASDALRYRRQILGLRHALSEMNCTALFISNSPIDAPETVLHSLVNGVIKLSRTAPAYGDVRRRLLVSKVRAMPFREGYHDYRIQVGGLEVFPRLKTEQTNQSADWQTVSSGNQEIDRLLGGGLQTGTACLIAGQSGTGKSIIATQYAHFAAARGEASAIFIFDERLELFLKRAANLDMDVRPYHEEGLVQLRQVNTGEVSPGEFAHLVREAVEEKGVKLVVIDSLTGYLNAMPEERLLLTQMHELLTYLNQKGVLTLLIVTQHGLLEKTVRDPLDASYLADTVILLRHFEASGTVRQAISVVKQRSHSHEKTIREFIIGSEGVRVGPPLTEFSGVLSGTPVYHGKQGQLLDFDEDRHT